MNESEVKAGATLTAWLLAAGPAASRLLHLGSMYLLVAFWLLWVVPANNFDTNRSVCRILAMTSFNFTAKIAVLLNKLFTCSVVLHALIRCTSACLIALITLIYHIVEALQCAFLSQFLLNAL